MGRAPCCEKVVLKRGRWTAEEDEILTQYILAMLMEKVLGDHYPRIQSCRLRWINYLRADLKRGNITTKEEEETIVKLHTAFGNRWSLIAAHLPGRTDNEIKNYWNSHLSRKIYSFTKNNNTDQSLTTAVTGAATNINIANIGGPCKCYKDGGGGGGGGGGGRVMSRSADMMKKEKNTATLMLIAGKSKNNTDQIKEKEAVIKENNEILGLSRETQENLTVNAGKKIMGFGPTSELEDSTSVSDIDVQISNGERLNAPEGWEPYEWQDSEINRLKYFLEAISNQAVNNSSGSVNKEEEVEEESGDCCNNWCSSSPVNLAFDEEWYNLSFDWDCSVRDHINNVNDDDSKNNDLWDEGDNKILSWL